MPGCLLVALALLVAAEIGSFFVAAEVNWASGTRTEITLHSGAICWSRHRQFHVSSTLVKNPDGSERRIISMTPVSRHRTPRMQISFRPTFQLLPAVLPWIDGRGSEISGPYRISRRNGERAHVVSSVGSSRAGIAGDREAVQPQAPQACISGHFWRPPPPNLQPIGQVSLDSAAPLPIYTKPMMTLSLQLVHPS